MLAAAVPLRSIWATTGIVFVLILVIGVTLPESAVYLLTFGVIWLVLLAVSKLKQIKVLAYALVCRTLHGPHISIHFHPNLQGSLQGTGLLDAFESDYADLVKWFGFALPNRVSIYMMPCVADVGKIVGRGYGGYAFFRELIIVTFVHDQCRCVFRHELAHLFAERLGPSKPVFKNEGLCMWFEYGGSAPLLDLRSRQYLESCNICELLQSPDEWKDPQVRQLYYLFAGSFTGFLIRHFGWSKFRAFYEVAKPRGFGKTFDRSFGMTLEEAVARWRDSLDK
jgi:hypothetical protein